MNDKKYKELVEKAISQLDGGYIEFSGMNCHYLEHNYCLGWNGIDRRCFCGNRRVSWVCDDEENPTSVYAEAF